MLKKMVSLLLILGAVMSPVITVRADEIQPQDIVVNTAYEQLGKPYVWGSDIFDTSSHDCSSLVAYCYYQVGISLPRCSYEQAEVGIPVSIDEIQPGDIVCMRTSSRNDWTNGTSHVGIYVGDGNIVEARSSAYGVCITRLEDRAGIITTIRRVIE